MSSASKSGGPSGRRAPQGSSGSALGPAATCVVAWLVPGGAHFLHGESRTATLLAAALVTMFVVGIAAGGRLFPFQVDEPLVFLEAVAQWMLGLPRMVGGLAGYGTGAMTSSTYEYGNTFLITAGLLNTLAVLDAFDLATARKVA